MKKAIWNSGWFFQKADGRWVPVTLPHDAMQAVGRSKEAPSGSGGAHYAGGAYCYRKQFVLTQEEAAGTLQVQFDGVYRNAKVLINGKLAAQEAYGYLPFFADMTGKVHIGENIIEVYADNSAQPNSRWYSGGGIYRSVTLWTGAKNCIAPWDVRISTVAIYPAKVRVEIPHGVGCPEIEIFDGKNMVAKAMGTCVEIEVPNAKLWSDGTPQLYRCHVMLLEKGVTVDETEQMFGIRTLHWDTTGFYVNGQRTMLRGGCIHHDNGILGACSVPEAEERRLKIMKKAGFNAIRSAHNPASTALLEACDRLGIYVMNEAWDMWYQRKNKYDYGMEFPANWKKDVRSIVSRDFSHPSVVMYSIGNEVTEPYEEKGMAQGKEIISLFHELDAARPVTIGLNMALLAMSAMGIGLFDRVDEPKKEEAPAVNSTAFNEIVSRNNNLPLASCKAEVDALASPILDAVDIAGYNYGAPRYPLDAEQHPNRIVVGSETFPHELADVWETMKQYPYVIGDFMWTAWDYIGECGIGTWAHTKDGLAFEKPYPWKLADAGAFDLIGNPTGEALWAAAVWNGEMSVGVRPVPYPDETLAKGSWRGTNAVPSWAWAGCEGKETTVEVYTVGVKVELHLNGQKVGEAPVQSMRAIFQLPYRQGTLEAIAYDADEHELDRKKLCSAGSNPHWKICEESESLQRGQIAFFKCCLQDEQGNIESNRDVLLHLQVRGGELLGFGSGAPRTESEFQTGIYESFYGRTLAAIRMGAAGKLCLGLYDKSGAVLTEKVLEIKDADE